MTPPLRSSKPPPAKVPIGRRFIAWLSALAVLLVVGGLSAMGWPGPRVDTQAVTRRDFVQTVAASGYVAASQGVASGDAILPGVPPAGVSPAQTAQLVVAVDEKNIALLGLGQRALAWADGYPAQRFVAVVAYIHPAVHAGTGAVEVKLRAAAPPAELRPDMAVQVVWELARHAQALGVPISAVRDANLSPSVLRLEDRRAVRRGVVLGLRSDGLAEVISGLSEGDTVLVGPSDVKAGARVRATPAVSSASAAAAS